MKPDYSLAVVGSGIAAKALALGAAQAGLKVALIGAKPLAPPSVAAQADAANDWDQRVYAISPGSQALLDQLSVWQAIPVERIGAVYHMAIEGDAGGHLHFSAYEAQVERLASMMEQRAIETALDAALSFMKPITRIADHATALQIEGFGARLHIGMQSLLAECVVGADGAQSWVREAAGITAQRKPYGVTAVVAHFACEQAHQQTARQWFTDEGILALLPLANPHRVSMVWSAPEAKANALLGLTPAALAEAASIRSGHSLGQLSDAQAIGAYPLQLLKVSSLVAERVALVGDAAHVVHPLAGQGLNLGLQDVRDFLAVLAERENWRDCGDARVLARYARRRAEPIQLMQWTTDSLHHLFAQPHPLTNWLRNTGMRCLDPVKPLKRLLIGHALG